MEARGVLGNDPPALDSSRCSPTTSGTEMKAVLLAKVIQSLGLTGTARAFERSECIVEYLAGSGGSAAAPLVCSASSANIVPSRDAECLSQDVPYTLASTRLISGLFFFCAMQPIWWKGRERSAFLRYATATCWDRSRQRCDRRRSVHALPSSLPSPLKA